MRTDAPVPEHPAPPSSPASPQRIRLIDRITAYRQPIGLVFTLLLFGLALVACYHLLREIDPGALHDAIADVPRPALLGALSATALGFVILLGYEWSASRFAGVTLPMRSLATGGFSAFAIGNAVGLSPLSGGSVRYRLYSRHGIGAAEIARMTLFASLSLAAHCRCWRHSPHSAISTMRRRRCTCPTPWSPSSRSPSCCWLSAWWRSWPGTVCRENGRPRQPAGPPRPPQPAPARPAPVAAATADHRPDVAAAATVLYLLLPETPPFAAFLLVYLLALAAGVLSHVPGGVGVFEAVLLAAFAGQLGAAAGRGPALVPLDLRGAAAAAGLPVVAVPRSTPVVGDTPGDPRRLGFRRTDPGDPGLPLRCRAAVFRRHTGDRHPPGAPRLPHSTSPDRCLAPGRQPDRRALPAARAGFAPTAVGRLGPDPGAVAGGRPAFAAERLRLGRSQPAEPDRRAARHVPPLLLPSQPADGSTLLRRSM